MTIKMKYNIQKSFKSNQNETLWFNKFIPTWYSKCMRLKIFVFKFLIYFVSSICFRILFYYNYNTRINRFEQATIFSCKINFWNFMLLLTRNEFQIFFSDFIL